MNRLSSIFKAFLSIERLKPLTNHRFFKSRTWETGVPMLVFIFGSYIWLYQFHKLKYERGQVQKLSEKAELNIGRSLKTEDLESVYNDVMEKHDIHNWQNIRGPREGENSREMQAEQRRQFGSLQKNTLKDSSLMGNLKNKQTE
ncbi:cytochrome c oxidase assembly protein COX16 homolog, mitochondrial-like [Mytilus californianus]|uniref:cytochrome c oxidase assembly protein COX16 homolog, mitochondrial-like n=1 Tax=Mytilus californianus TaxID=6549 RepID=UPI002246D250|nr:cytochrome c oxidase assembly protein COX16 homolog, mitochondrial-like [Mytilus californianus]